MAPGVAGVRSRSDVLLILDIHAVVRDVAVYLSASPSKFLILRVQQHESKGNKPLVIHPWYVRGFDALVSRLWTLVELACRRPNRRKAGTSPQVMTCASWNCAQMIKGQTQRWSDTLKPLFSVSQTLSRLPRAMRCNQDAHSSRRRAKSKSSSNVSTRSVKGHAGGHAAS